MKALGSDPGPASTLGQAVNRLPRRWPIATMSTSAAAWSARPSGPLAAR
jgi:hypothetical protein